MANLKKSRILTITIITLLILISSTLTLAQSNNARIAGYHTILYTDTITNMDLGSGGRVAISGGLDVSDTIIALGGNSGNWNTAFAQRGSQIAGLFLTWNSDTNKLDVSPTNIAQGTRTATTVLITSSTGTPATLNIATDTLAGVMSAADKSKLDGLPDSADNYASWTLAGDSGTAQTIGSMQTATITGGTGISTVAGSTRQVTINLDLVTVPRGGTGKTILAANKVLVGNGEDAVISPTNLHWDNTNSRLGIGITSPSRALDVSGDIAGTRLISTATDDQNHLEFSRNDANYIMATGGDSAYMAFITGDRARGVSGGQPNLVLKADKKSYFNDDVGIGIDAPTEKLHVKGNAIVTGNVYASAFIHDSDIELKENLVPLNNALNKITSLNTYTFNFKESKEQQIGIIAQELEKIYPELVHEKGEYKGVDYSLLVVPAIQAIKEQQEQINELTQKLEEQQQTINELTKLINS
ncbi:tail fiber domain-containing protein [Candidatus Woesearchaeota archaeon]|nr:tail fiber domain-containing protein [Candidatus Woesearchaeota archaeon]